MSELRLKSRRHQGYGPEGIIVADDPANGETLVTYEKMAPQEVRGIVGKVHEAFFAWHRYGARRQVNRFEVEDDNESYTHRSVRWSGSLGTGRRPGPATAGAVERAGAGGGVAGRAIARTRRARPRRQSNARLSRLTRSSPSRRMTRKRGRSAGADG
jgi:hypothetical protein